MLFPKSFIKVADNSGAKYVRCFKVLKTLSAYGKRKHACVGDVILASVRFNIPRKQVKKGEVYKALVVRTRAFVQRRVGHLWLTQNSVILLDKKGQPLSTRVFGPVAREVRVNKYEKLATTAKLLV